MANVGWAYKEIAARTLLCLALSFAGPSALAEGAAPLGLLDETMLHPVDAFTGSTLRAGEIIYNQSVASLPLPSWAMVGVTDWLTVNVDFVSILGGLAIEPHYPLPSINMRFRLAEADGLLPDLAFEAMYFRLWEPFEDQLDPKNTVRLERDGATAFARVNATWPLSAHARVHASTGLTWTEYIRIENRNREVLRGRTIRNGFNPDASLAFDWRPLPWMSLHISASYGSTFVYLDLVPRKAEIAYGARFAPFYLARGGFLRALRVEAAAFAMYFRDAEEWLFLPVPVYPVLYWQWELGG